MTFYPATRGDRQPYFTHDCDECRFRGSFVEVTKTGGSAVYDVWVHGANLSEDKSIIMRFGSVGSEYQSFPRHIVELLKDHGGSEIWAYALNLAETTTMIRPPRNNVQDPGDAPFTVLRFGRHDRSDDHGGAYRTWRVIETDNHDEEEVDREMLSTWYPARRCHHEHDCCGNYYPSSPKITRLPNGLYLVVQDFTQNV